MFLIRFHQICPNWIKLDQTWSNLIKLDQSSTFYKILIINLLAHGNNKMVICFWSDSIRSVQIGSNLIKFDHFSGSLTFTQTFPKFSTFYEFLIILPIYLPLIIKIVICFCSDSIRSVQNRSNSIKLGFLTYQKMLI